MTQAHTKDPYNGAVVMGINAELANSVVRRDYTIDDDTYMYAKDRSVSCLRIELDTLLEPRLRCEAETDPSFKQIIPYAIVGYASLGKYFVTRRIGGDERLIGKISIGLGGHVEAGESIEDALCRELNEEIDLPKECVESSTFCGFLNPNETQVDQLHFGCVYRIFTINENLRSMEPDKFEGFWATHHEIRYMREKGMLETWSELLFDYVLEGKQGNKPWLYTWTEKNKSQQSKTPASSPVH